jgi:hypothetical protein
VPGLVGGEQVLYWWTSTRPPSTASIRRAAEHSDAVPEAIGCFALRAGSGFVVALRGGFGSRRLTGAWDGRRRP